MAAVTDIAREQTRARYPDERCPTPRLEVHANRSRPRRVCELEVAGARGQQAPVSELTRAADMVALVQTASIFAAGSGGPQK